MGAGTTSHKNNVYLFEVENADASKLNDVAACTDMMRKLIDSAGLHQISTLNHEFQPQGVSIISLLAESHIALHTWPETSNGYVTLTTCKLPADGFTEEAQKILGDAFGTVTVKVSRL